ncbi:MAG: TVP38/TMEM64 family protein [Chlamydiae bacterium]|jgi:uncharacterized membrane protein YdjX (TVP38/TMEM64 family)|nr:TVP38/TMEM64 family protein [Chlamydiota bacterium]
MKFFPLLFLFIGVLVFYLFFGFDYVSIEAILTFQEKFAGGAVAHVVFLFIFFYLVYAIASLPGLLFLDVVSGLLFGQFWGFIIAWLSAATGALIVFLSVNYAVSDLAVKKNQNLIKRVEEGFQKHSLNYLLFLRLVPCMPFGLVNITLGFLKINKKSFIWTTLLGILPLSFFYTHAGAGISHIIQTGHTLSINSIMNRYVILALIGLGFLTLVPILIKRKG